MKRIGQRYILLSIIAGCFILYYVFCIEAKKAHYIKASAERMASCISIYAKSHGGRLPKTQTDLIDAGMLKVDPAGTANRLASVYFAVQYERDEKRLFNADFDWAFYDVDKYAVGYGVNIAEITEKDRVLYRDQDRFYFIKGPEHILFAGAYDKINLELYRAIKHGQILTARRR